MDLELHSNMFCRICNIFKDDTDNLSLRHFRGCGAADNAMYLGKHKYLVILFKWKKFYHMNSSHVKSTLSLQKS